MIENRNKIIISACVVNIIVTLFLASVKITLGIISDSQAMIVGAISYYSDVLITVTILISVYLANKEPDKKHPFGYGRIEYVSTLLIALFVIVSGVLAIKKNIGGIFAGAEPHYTWASLAILGVTVIAKYILSRYLFKKRAESNSDSILAIAASSKRTAMTTLFVIGGAIVFICLNINLDAYIGIFIGCLVVKAGLKLLKLTVEHILGERYSFEESNAIKATIRSFEGVKGAYDLQVHNYGPDNTQGSVHIEVDADMKMGDLDTLERKIVNKVKHVHGVVLTGISIYAVDDSIEENVKLREAIREYAISVGALGTHGFYIDRESKFVSFDVVFDLEDKGRVEAFQSIRRFVREQLPDYQITMVMDLNYTD